MISRVKKEVNSTSVDEGRNGRRNVEYQFHFRIHDIPKGLNHVIRSEIFNSYLIYPSRDRLNTETDRVTR